MSTWFPAACLACPFVVVGVALMVRRLRGNR